MTPLPLHLLAAFPQAHDRVPERPWWTRQLWPEGVDYLRTDGTRLSLRREPSQMHPEGVRDSCTLTLGGGRSLGVGAPINLLQPALHILGEVDQRLPISHPGFRPGQVWAMDDAIGYCAMQIVETYLADASDPDHAEGLWATVVAGPDARYSDNLGGRKPLHYREDRLRAQLASWFLLADPACPHLAPWAPGAP